MKKIAVITATRAEYGLLKPLIKGMLGDDFFNCNVIVTGTHLLEKYGNTVKFIENDEVPISYKIPIMNEEENIQEEVIAKAIIEFSDLYRKEVYDAIVVLGDRYELYGFCIPAMLQRIPIIHIHGGEKTEGAIDEKIRHSITKMASIHFASMNEYAKRIMQMGENPEYVYTVGALGIDNIKNIDYMSVKELEEELKVDFSKNIAIVTFHPVTVDDEEKIEEQVKEVFEALIKEPIYSIVTMPNSDRGGEVVLNIIEKYVENYNDKIKFVHSLGQLRYLSCLKYAKIVIGNSSSGIIETASFHIPTVDIGNRQKGRVFPKNVIHCECEMEKISESIELGLSESFQAEIADCENPYGAGNAAEQMINILKNIKWDKERLITKPFYDINVEV